MTATVMRCAAAHLQAAVMMMDGSLPGPGPGQEGRQGAARQEARCVRFALFGGGPLMPCCPPVEVEDDDEEPLVVPKKGAKAASAKKPGWFASCCVRVCW